MPLKENSGVGMNNDKIQDEIVMNGVSSFFPLFSPSLCEIAYSKSKRGRLMVFLPPNRC